MSGTILERIAAGDRAAVDECLTAYGGLVWSVARRMTSSASDAEDAVQEIFIDLWQSAGRYDPQLAGEATFVVTIARRRLIDRRRKLDRTPDTRPLDPQALSQLSNTTGNRVEVDDEAATAAGCLAQLKPDERRVLELAIYHDLPQSQIAEVTGLPLGTVKTNSRRGLIRLRELMQARTVKLVKGGAP